MWSVLEIHMSVTMVLLKVGLMRSGKLLAQSKPDDLIRAFNVAVSCSIRSYVCILLLLSRDHRILVAINCVRTKLH